MAKKAKQKGKGKRRSFVLLPTELKIGGHHYTICNVKSQNLGEREAGHIEYNKNEIVIDCSGSPNQVLVTLLHEILHGLNPERGEMDVEYLAQGLTQIVLDNIGFGNILESFAKTYKEIKK